MKSVPNPAPQAPSVPFFARKAADQTIVVKTGVRAGARESAAKAMEGDSK